MINFIIKRFFQQKKPAPAPATNSLGIRIPVAGEKCWRLVEKDNSPWPVKIHETPIEILDIRDGWVRYSIGSSSFCKDRRATLDIFLRIYQTFDETKP